MIDTATIGSAIKRMWLTTRLTDVVTAWFILVAVFVGASAHAQKAMFRPQVGQNYDYGVEFQISEAGKKEFMTINETHRCRLRYEITKASDNGWTANYKTIPFFAGRPAKSREYLDAWRQRIRDIDKNSIILSSKRPLNTGPNSQIVNRQNSQLESLSKKMQSESSRRKARQLDLYASFFSFCEGQIVADQNGNVVVQSGDGDLPVALGHIAKLPFVNLPANGEISGGFTSRDTNYWSHKKDPKSDDEVRAELNLLSLLEPRKASEQGIMSFNRDVDASGGTDIGAKMILMGKGFWEYAPQIKMPFAGNVNYKATGISYLDLTRNYNVSIGFHHLDALRAKLFDRGFIPSYKALEISHTPRLSPKQQSYLKSGIETVLKQTQFRLSIQQEKEISSLRDFAPLQAGTPLMLTLQKLDDRINNEPKRQIFTLQGIFARWDLMRTLATEIPRTWADDSNSFQIRARLVALDGLNVSLKRADNGKVVSLPVTKLSTADQEFAKTYGMPSK